MLTGNAIWPSSLKPPNISMLAPSNIRCKNCRIFDGNGIEGVWVLKDYPQEGHRADCDRFVGQIAIIAQRKKAAGVVPTTSQIHGRDDWIRTSGLTVPKKFQRSKIGFTVLAVKSLFGI